MRHGGGKEWYTAAELAELSLPGIGGVKRRVNELASAERWALAVDGAGMPLARPRQARGGGLEYHYSILPTAARTALGMLHMTDIADVSATPPTEAMGGAAQLWRWFAGAGEKVRIEAERRLTIVQTVDTYVAIGMTRSAAVSAVAKEKGVGASTLWGYLTLLDGVATADRLVYLAPRRQGGGTEAEISADAWQWFKSDYLRLERPTFSSCYGRMLKQFPGQVMPTERTLRRKLEREVDGRLIVAKREGMGALDQMVPVQTRSVLEMHALEAVTIDGHKFDVFVQWDEDTIIRPMMVALQDIYSRKIVAWRVDMSENAYVTRLVFADLFRNYGIPVHALLDNSRAFASKIMTGGTRNRFRFRIRDDEPTGVLTALGIQIHFTKPYSGQSKPIERAFRDMCDTIAKDPRLAGAYTGNRPDAKPENYGSRAIPKDLFLAVVSQGIAAHNAKPNRRTETAQGRFSFDEVFAKSYAVAPIGKASDEMMRLALLTAEEKTAHRKTGELTLDGNRYWAEPLRDHAGEKLIMRFDPDNLHAEVHVYDRTNTFICTAPAIQTSAFFSKAEAARAGAAKAELRRQVKDIERLQNLIDAKELAAMMPSYPDEEEALPAPGVVRPVRHRGQTKGALRPVSEGAQRSLNPALDRLAGAMDASVVPFRRAG